MSPSITETQAKAIRAGGYFIFVVAFLSSFHWLSIVREDYVMEHQWPSASATVYTMREDSREVTPSSIRQHRYWVYWVEFLVVLDLPREQCPGEMRTLNDKEEQCTGEVKTPEVKSRADAVRWFSRHPRNSRLILHYDPKSGKMVAGGEPILDVYPMDQIRLTAILFTVAALMVVFARSRLAVPEYPQGALR